MAPIAGARNTISLLRPKVGFRDAQKDELTRCLQISKTSPLYNLDSGQPTILKEEAAEVTSGPSRDYNSTMVYVREADILTSKLSLLQNGG